ncbi:hypothetical protein FF38_09665, partial [Lucilia cuprina]
MAPVKNPNSTNKNSTNSSNSHSHNSIPPAGTTAVASNATNSSHSSNPSSSHRKQTGTVPKASTKSSTNCNSSTVAGQKPLLQPSGLAQLANRCSPLNIVASIQQQQQQQQQQHTRNQQQQQQHKNTEIVAPIRRELKDLNDYLLTTVLTTTTNNTNNLNNNNNKQQQQQLQTTAGQHQHQSNTTATNSDFENSQENQQRFCYPVRPIPRRNQQTQQQQQQQQQQQLHGSSNQQTQSDFLNCTQNSNTNLNTAIGVVIPTTPGLSSSSTATQSVQPVASNINTTLNDNSLLGPQFEQHLQLLVVQRLKQLFENTQTQPFLNLTSNILPTIQASSSANLANAVLNHNSNEFNQLAQRFQQTLNANNNHKINLENSLQAQQKVRNLIK